MCEVIGSLTLVPPATVHVPDTGLPLLPAHVPDTGLPPISAQLHDRTESKMSPDGGLTAQKNWSFKMGVLEVFVDFSTPQTIGEQ